MPPARNGPASVPAVSRLRASNGATRREPDYRCFASSTFRKSGSATLATMRRQVARRKSQSLAAACRWPCDVGPEELIIPAVGFEDSVEEGAE